MKQNTTWLWAGLVVLIVLGALAWLLLRPSTSPTDTKPAACGPDVPCASGQVCCDGACRVGVSCDEAMAPDPVAGPDAGRRRTAAGGATEDGGVATGAVSPVPVVVDPPAAGRCVTAHQCDGNLTHCNESGTCVEGPSAVCIGDRDCAGGRKCFRGSCTDQPTACRDVDCQGPGYCNAQFGECESHRCDTDEQCAGNRRCHVEKHYCVQCLEDGDCEGAQRCLHDLCMEPEKCTSNDDCLGDRVCVKADGRCIPTECKPDAQEPNDDKKSASPLASNSAIEDVHVCMPDEDDNYAVDLDDTGAVIQVLYDASVGAMEVRFYAPDGHETMRAFDHQHDGTITGWFEKPEQPGRHIVRVHYGGGHGAAHGAILHYTIRRIDVPGGFCINDESEPNDTFKQARELELGPKQTYRLCHRDEDWFKVHLDEGQKVVLRPTRDVDPDRINDDSPAAPDVEVYLNTPDRMILRDTSPFPNKELPLVATESGDYYIRILPPLVDENAVYYFQATAQ